MRFTLEPSRYDLYRLCVGEKTIDVRLPSLKRQFKYDEGIEWTWWDGGEYAAQRPRCPNGEIFISVDGDVICCGQMMNRIRKTRAAGRDKAVLSRWEFDDQIIMCEGSDFCCKIFPRRISFRRQDGRLMAVFVPVSKRLISRDAGYKGVLRENISADVFPVICGIILAVVHASS